MIANPFVTSGYVGADYFCDREQETDALVSLLTNGNNVALISQRRFGKTDLIKHCFAQPKIARRYHTFVIDVYATDTLSDFVNCLGRAVLDALKPRGRRVWERFLGLLKSMRTGISYDANGTPSWTVELGELANPSVTLDEIFTYLQTADRPCLVAIDEFQQVTKYSEGNLEALLRTHIQNCPNAKFVFAGSQRTLMGAIFTSPSRPFYQSVSVVNLDRIPCVAYVEFCRRHFSAGGRILDEGVVEALYARMDGVTYYMQKVMNALYMRTRRGRVTMEMLDAAVDFAIGFASAIYEDMVYQLPTQQKKVLYAIAREGKVENILSGGFASRNRLRSVSSVNSAVKGLLERNVLTHERGRYSVYDKFFEIWLKRGGEGGASAEC